MSNETVQDLNLNTLIGMTDKRGNAWHYRQQFQGEESNHYPLAIPVEDVRRRLFCWKAVEGTVVSEATIPAPIDGGFEDLVIRVTDRKRKTIIRPDTGVILGVFSGQPGEEWGYKIHQYEEWLLDEVSLLLEDELGVSSAGLLAQGGIAWVEVSVPDTIVTPSGVKFRPNLLCTTSLDGSISTTFKRTITDTVCDNTRAVALGERSPQVKIRHTRNSAMKLAETREALGIVYSMADDFALEVERLTNTTVTDNQWAQFMDELFPVPKDKGRSQTITTNKRSALDQLWTTDPRVTPWKGTAWGALQAVNTAVHHVFTVKGDRAERNMLRTIEGDFDALDIRSARALESVLA